MRREGETLVLRFDESRSYLMADSVEAELANLASWLELDHKMVVGEL